MSLPPAIHYLRPNHVERSPHRLLVVDTETAPVDDRRQDTQSLRLWCATLTRRHNIEPKKPREEKFRGGSAGKLAATIDGLANSGSSLWVMCHNLNFDLAVTELPVALVALGWRVTEAALTTDDPWFRAAKGSKRITCVDSWSYLPASVETLGHLLNLPKLKMPKWTAPADQMWRYCERDVAIVTTAMIQLMDWWDAEALGNWSLTGPSTGWSSYRHGKPTPKVLVDPDPEARELEADAITGGRRLVTRIGKQPAGLYADLDFEAAHLTVMANVRLPWRRLRSFESMEIDDAHLSALWTDILAVVTVESASPRYPLRTKGGIFYPVGRFETILPGPEIRDAAKRGELRAIGRGYVYATSYHMQPWAQWVRSLIDASNADTPPAVRLAAKAWSRSVPGKWDGHTSEVIERVPDLRPGWLAEHGKIAATGAKADFLLLGHERWTIARDLWADDAFPAILAFIQSHTRLALGRVIDALGSSVLTANTDGVMVDVLRVPAGPTEFQPEADSSPADQVRWLEWRCRDLSALAAPFVIRTKTVCSRLTIISPQHLLMGRKRKLAGVPQSARRDAKGRYTFTSWPKLRVQIERPHAPSYTTKRRTVNLANVPPAGWLFKDGRVGPVTCYHQLTDTCPSVLIGGPSKYMAPLAPTDRQHPLLRPLMALEAT
jgi:hypothetical protein